MHQMYRKYVPNIMDDSLSLYEQMIAVIEHINNLVRTSDSLSDEITTDMNELITEVNNIRDFSLPENVVIVLRDWQESGFLNVVIDEALQTQIDVVAQDVVDLTDEVVNNGKHSFTGSNVISLQAFDRTTTETNDSGRLERAILDTPTNGTLYIGENIEVGHTLTINKPINIVGNFTTIKMTTPGMDNVFYFRDTHDVTISNLRFDGNLLGRTTIEFLNTSQIRIENCYFTGFSKEYGYYQTDGGLRFNDCLDVIITNNIWYEHGYQYDTTTADLNRCISIQGSTSNVTITNNIFNKVNQAIITAYGKNMTIANNKFVEVKDNSLYILGSKFVSITGNSFNDYYDESIVMSGENITIDGNTFNNPRKLFVINQHLTGLVISNNVIKTESTTNLANILDYRQNTHIVTNMVFSGNIFDIPFTDTVHPYFNITGDCLNFTIDNNIFNLATLNGHVVMDFKSKATGNIRNNRIATTNATDIALRVTESVDSLICYENNEVNCRAGMGDSIIHRGQRVQTNIGPYVLNRPNNNFLFSDRIPERGTWKAADIIIRTNPAHGQYIGWICTVGGTPGTWKGFGMVEA